MARMVGGSLNEKGPTGSLQRGLLMKPANSTRLANAGSQSPFRGPAQCSVTWRNVQHGAAADQSPNAARNPASMRVMSAPLTKSPRYPRPAITRSSRACETSVTEAHFAQDAFGRLG